MPWAELAVGSPRAAHGFVTRLRARSGRPAGIVDRARWLFTGLAVLSTLMALPATLFTATGVRLSLGLASTVVLVAMWVGVYLTGRFPVWRDVAIALAICGFALACPDPTAALASVFAAAWLGCLYGSTRRSVARCAMYFAAMVATLPLWRLLPGHTMAPVPGALLGFGPTLLLTVFVGRQLAIGLESREQGLHHDRALADLGARMLAVTDAAGIRALASSAAADICSATPGLRVLYAVRDGFALRVELAVGDFATKPTTLLLATIVPASATRGWTVDPGELDSAVGTVLVWTCVHLDDDRDDGWTLIGAPRQLPAPATLAVRSVMVMMALALRNSDVHQQLSVQARIDSLTGLANRAAFTVALAEALARPPAINPVHLLFLDLDDFKDVNDGYGHRAGDAILTEVGVRLRTCTRTYDVCARLGGDEFAVVLVDTPAAAATDIAERMVSVLNEPFRVGDHSAQIGASIGLVASPAAGFEARSARVDSPGADELCHQADVAMYAAKASGKGQIRWFDSALRLSASAAATVPLARPA